MKLAIPQQLLTLDEVQSQLDAWSTRE
jgi:hypothetical protein